MLIQDGFNNQRLIAIPKEMLQKKADVCVTNIGYFPNAAHHYMQRTHGCSEHIIILCTAGKGFIHCPHSQNAISGNTLTVIPKNTPHTYGADRDAPWNIYWAHFLTVDALPFDRPAAVHITKEQTKTLANIFNNMIHCLIESIDTDAAALNNAALAYILALFTHHRRPKTQQPQIIIDTKNYVLAHLDEPLCVQTLVDTFGCSKSYLHYTYQNTLGEPPISYLTKVKLDIAANYLQITQMSIKQIALSLGYKDPYYFSRLFKKLYQQSPKQFRDTANAADSSPARK